MPPRADPHRLLPIAALLLAAGVLAGCSSTRRGTPDNEPTIASLAKRKVTVAPDRGIAGGEEESIAAYRKFLDVAPQAPQRAEAMRRLGDLHMDSADNRAAGDSAAASASGAPDYRAAVAHYEAFLRAYPKDAGNDRVLYQLARAQEQSGELETALKTLERLVAEYPRTAHSEEAHFRRGELLFTLREYARAEQAYALVIAGPAAGGTSGGAGGGFRERALYMQGWSLFKQGRLEESLHAFFAVLDLKLATLDEEGDETDALSRADRELVEDSFRVTSLSLTNLQGADTIPAYITSDVRRGYEFRVYAQLGEFYLKQDRPKDAADAFASFARLRPLHAQAPVLQARVIDIHERSGFATLALEAKKDYVSRYGLDGEFRRANPAGWERAQPLVKTHLGELAQHYHASAQKSRASGEYQEAARWYRAWLAAFPDDADAAQNNFLLAELLVEDGRLAEAAAEYERTAYDRPRHARSADAGYAALLAYANQQKQAAPADVPALQRASVDSAARFAQAFADDTRAGAVLTDAAEKLFVLGQGERAAGVAGQVLALKPAASPSQRRTAWTVLAHTAFDRGAFQEAERGYGEVLALMTDKAAEKEASRGDIVERLAASVYKQGEKARAEGRAQEAVGHFARVASLAPESSVRATADYDAAAALIGLKDWAGAARGLEDFRRRHPNHPLQNEVRPKLALAYLEGGQWAQAATELERVAADQKDPALARDALWQAAELYEKAAAQGGKPVATSAVTTTVSAPLAGEKPAKGKAGKSRSAAMATAPKPAADPANPRALAAQAYERYLARFPQPLEPALEARLRLARIAKADGQPARELALMREIQQADLTAGSARTPRTRTLGAIAALAVAEPAAAAYREVALVEPLQKQLKLKKTRMEDALKAYAVAADYGVAEVTTAATHHSAALYRDFGRSMIASQRPKRLSKAELEQYDVMLEEQAFPFEERAIELHETNARRAAGGIYDPWVQASFKALAELKPVRWSRNERAEGGTDAIR